MHDVSVISAALLTGVIAAAATPAAAQPSTARWWTPQPALYDPVCGEPESGECYAQPATGILSQDGRFGISLFCGATLGVEGARGPGGDLQFTSVAFAVDGAPMGQFQIGGGLDTDYLDPQASPALIAALRGGSALTAVFNGGTAAAFSLTGSSAAITALERICNGEAAEPPQQAQATRQRQYFDDYMATCRPDGGCDAATFSETPTSDGNVFHSSLTLNRAGFPGTAWIMTFAGAFEGPVPGTPIQVRIGQQNWTLAAGQGYSELMGHNFFNWPVNEQILAAMRGGNAMEITQTIQNGASQTVRYSLRGLNGAMAWIDQLQGRSGEPAMIGVPMSLDEIVPGYEPAQ